VAVLLRPFKLDVLGQLQADLDRRGTQRGQHEVGDEGVQGAPGEALAGGFTAVHLQPGAAVLHAARVGAVVGGHAVAASAANQEPGQQRRAAARDPDMLAPVGRQLPLVPLVGLPRNVGR